MLQIYIRNFLQFQGKIIFCKFIQVETSIENVFFFSHLHKVEIIYINFYQQMCCFEYTFEAFNIITNSCYIFLYYNVLKYI